MQTILFSALPTDFERKLAGIFAKEDFRVVVAEGDEGWQTLQPGEAVDIFIDTTDVRLPEDGFTLLDGVRADVIERTFRKNVLHSMQLLEKYLPNLDAGQGKRLCWLSDANASLNATRDTQGYGYNMAKAALHQFIQKVSNKLTPRGYSFRVFDPLREEVSPEAAAGAAFHYITRRRGTENHDPRRDDENNLTLYDAQGRAHPW
ncbi:MAG: hypothetical protein FWC71_11415 [Defluviitaleaceae bacterium]|nr:hypothetical protein [Defluviitaleaceae bacterium]